MVALSRNPAAGMLLNGAMFTCFSLMGIYWLEFGQLGGFPLKAYYIGMLCMIAATATSLNGVPSVWRVVAYCAPWFLPYIVYLGFLLPAVVGTPGTGLWFRQVFFVATFLCVAAYFCRAADLGAKLRWGSIVGIALFLAFTEYSAHQIGKSLVVAIGEFLQSGNLQALIFKFFRPVFNSFEDGTELAFGASLSNSIAVALLVLSICFRIARSESGTDPVGDLITVGILGFALILNARSVVLAALASSILAFVMRLAAAKAASLGDIFYWSIAVVLGAGAIAAIALQGPSAMQSISTAFEFTDDSVESRLEQYQWAVGLIEHSPVLGNGYLVNGSGLPIHNLFLSSWAYVGLTGFALTIIFYIGFACVWFRWMFLVTFKPGYWTLPLRREWVAVLPLLPMFRVWLSGAGGHLASGEWIAIGIYVGLVMRNELSRYHGGQPSSYQGHFGFGHIKSSRATWKASLDS